MKDVTGAEKTPTRVAISNGYYQMPEGTVQYTADEHGFRSETVIGKVKPAKLVQTPEKGSASQTSSKLPEITQSKKPVVSQDVAQDLPLSLGSALSPLSSSSSLLSGATDKLNLVSSLGLLSLSKPISRNPVGLLATPSLLSSPLNSVNPILGNLLSNNLGGGLIPIQQLQLQHLTGNTGGLLNGPLQMGGGLPSLLSLQQLNSQLTPTLASVQSSLPNSGDQNSTTVKPAISSTAKPNDYFQDVAFVLYK